MDNIIGRGLQNPHSNDVSGTCIFDFLVSGDSVSKHESNIRDRMAPALVIDTRGNNFPWNNQRNNLFDNDADFLSNAQSIYTFTSKMNFSMEMLVIGSIGLENSNSWFIRHQCQQTKSWSIWTD